MAAALSNIGVACSQSKLRRRWSREGVHSLLAFLNSLSASSKEVMPPAAAGIWFLAGQNLVGRGRERGLEADVSSRSLSSQEDSTKRCLWPSRVSHLCLFWASAVQPQRSTGRTMHSSTGVACCVVPGDEDCLLSSELLLCQRLDFS